MAVLINSLVDIPATVQENDYDDLYDSIIDAKELGKAVLLNIPEDKSPQQYKQSIKQAMRGRGILINTMLAVDCLYVWHRANITSQ